jgi:hypothetical protein
METLTLEQLAPYLPFDVKVIWSDGSISIINPYIDETDYNEKFITLSLALFAFKQKDSIKLLLRPLSDLTKPIKHNGETFVPMEKLCNDFCNRTPCNPEFGTSKILMHADNGGGLKWWFVYHRNKMTFELSDDNRDMSNHTIPQYEMFQKLFEWHFDIFGLIERGLAIDINTIQIGI